MKVGISERLERGEGQADSERHTVRRRSAASLIFYEAVFPFFFVVVFYANGHRKGFFFLSIEL